MCWRENSPITLNTQRNKIQNSTFKCKIKTVIWGIEFVNFWITIKKFVSGHANLIIPDNVS